MGFRDIVSRLDGFINALSGIGTTSDRNRATKFSGARIFSMQELAELWDNDWLARRVCTIFPDHALRQGFKLEEGEDEELLEVWRKVNHSSRYPQGLFEEALSLGRLYGGVAIVIGLKTRGNDATTPAEPGAGEVAWIDIARPDQIKVHTRYDDQNREDHGEPEIYEIVGDHKRKGLLIHESRIILCEGLSREDRYLERSSYDAVVDWPWVSAIQPVYDVLANYGLSWASIGTLVQEASIGVFKMRGLFDMISTEDEATARKRVQLMSQTKSVVKAILLDADEGESYERVDASFKDLPQLMQQLMLSVAGAVKAPATLLFGQSPAGLNATGESDHRHFNDEIANYQRASIKPKLERLLSFVKGSPATIEFPNLWQPTAVEEEDLREKRILADKALYEMGAIEGLELIVARAEDGTLGINIDEATLAQKKKELADMRSIETDADTTSIELAPTDVARIITVNEARASQGLGPLRTIEGKIDPRGLNTISEFLAASEEKGKVEGKREGGDNGGTESNESNAPDESEASAGFEQPDEVSESTEAAGSGDEPGDESVPTVAE